MSTKHLSVAFILSAGTAMAEVPVVSVDIAPVHSLVAQVMDGVGTPDLIVDPGASPHGYQMRPSSASALQEADVVFWVGEGLTPWLENALNPLAEDAEIVELLDVAGLPLLENREDPTFATQDGHGEHGHDAHADGDEHHDEHDKHADGEEHHDEHEGHDEHAEKESHADHDDHAGHDDHHHDHGAFDPHAWLSPDIAAIWLGVIADTLSEADPANAETYAANAAQGQDQLAQLSAAANASLSDLRGTPFVVFHDAYQYFEVAFDLPSTGAILIGDAADPSPGRISAIQDHIRDEGVTCALAEPQFNPNLLATVMDGVESKTGVIDPLGADLMPGPDLYSALIENMVANLQDCLS